MEGVNKMKFLLSNLKHSITKQRLMTCLVLFVQLFSVIVIVFSYGVINHYNFKIDEKESTTLIYDFTSFDMENGEYSFVEMERVNEFIKEVLPYIEDKLDYFFIMGTVDDYMIQCSSAYEDGRFKLSTQLEHNIGVVKGDKFTEQQMNTSEKIMIAKEVDVDNDWCMHIGEDTYKAIGLLPDHYASDSIFVPYMSIPDKTQVYYMSLLFTEPLWESEYNEIVSMLKDTFGDTFNIPEFEGIINESSNRVYRDIIFITGFLILVCGVNYCIMYRYILDKRRREFAIARICGCSKYKAGIVYMVELIGVSTVVLVAGLMMYHHFILPKAIEVFSYIGLFYGMTVYLTIGAMYMGILIFAYVVLVWRFIRKTPAILVKEV